MNKKSPYPNRRILNHPLSPPSGILALHRVVLYDKIDPGPHPCHWCGKVLDWITGTKTKGAALLVDHLDSDRSNLAADNLVPSCNICNTTRTRLGIIQPGEVVAVVAGIRQRGVERTCIVCGTLFTIINSQAKYRQGRFCSRGCRNKGVAQESGAGIQPDELFITVQERGRTKRIRAAERSCEQCNKLFVVSLHRVKQGGGRFCSGSCAAVQRERIKND